MNRQLRDKIKRQAIDEVTTRDLLMLDYPDASEKDLEQMEKLIERYRGLPDHLQPKMVEFVKRMADNDEQVYAMGQRVTDGEITFEQMLDELEYKH